jgi:2-dehydropantoate 2-reductase
MARYAVIGAGGVGGYFGGRLARSGADVGFLARGAHLDAMRQHGLLVRSHYGDFHLERVQATSDPRELGAVDFILVCVKSWDTVTAAELVRPLLGPDTAVISLQNGVENEDQIAAVVGSGRTMGGLAYVIARIASAGVIEQIGPTAKVIFGERDGRLTPRGEAFARDCMAAGIDGKLSAEIESEIWRKFLYICAFSGTCTVARSSLGPVLKDPDTRALFVACMEEVKALADARGIRLESDIVPNQLALADGFSPEVKPSMLTDLERGNRLELDWLNGAVDRMGRELGVPTPANHSIYTALKLLRSGRNASAAERVAEMPAEPV